MIPIIEIGKIRRSIPLVHVFRYPQLRNRFKCLGTIFSPNMGNLGRASGPQEVLYATLETNGPNNARPGSRVCLRRRFFDL